MKYMGSKSRIAKDILEIILPYRTEDQIFVDIFCGGCNLIDKVNGRRIANDSNEYLIAMWKGLLKDQNRIKTISRDMYSLAKTNYKNDHEKTEKLKFVIGWIGWMASYNGKFYDGGYSGHDVKGRDYISEQIRNTEKQIPLLKGVEFTCMDYKDFESAEPCLIYCDPPYKGTTKYSTSKNFDHDHFWQWCRDQKAKGHTIFISEYDAPEDFKCIWEKQITNSLSTKTTYKPTEKLFTL